MIRYDRLWETMKTKGITQYLDMRRSNDLGSGIQLFDTSEKEVKLKLIDSKRYNGITDLIYERR